MLKHLQLRLFTSLESCLIAILAYLSYLLSNAFQISGIVSLLFCGMTMKHYCYPNMSIKTRSTTKNMFRVLSQLGENFVFIYLGINLFAIDGKYLFGLCFFTLVSFISSNWVDFCFRCKICVYGSSFKVYQFLINKNPRRFHSRGNTRKPSSDALVGRTSRSHCVCSKC